MGIWAIQGEKLEYPSEVSKKISKSVVFSARRGIFLGMGYTPQVSDSFRNCPAALKPSFTTLCANIQDSG